MRSALSLLALIAGFLLVGVLWACAWADTNTAVSVTNSVPTIPHSTTVPPLPAGASSDYKAVYYYVYECAYETNVNGVVTEFRTVNVTNTVNEYAPLLVIDVESCTSLASNDWHATGQQFLVKLGTNSAAFYRAKARIE